MSTFLIILSLIHIFFSYAQLTKEHFLQADENCPGAGAAGGLGFAFQSYLGARLEPGIRIVLEETGLEREMADADFVLTGEGRMDEQLSLIHFYSCISNSKQSHSSPNT